MSIFAARRTWTLALMVTLIVGARAASASTITLGTRITLSPTTFALPIEIADAVDVTSWDFSITYDPTDVQVNLACDPFAGDPYCSLLTGPVTEGDFFASGAPFNLLVPGFVAVDPITLAQTGLLFGVHGEYGGFPPLPSGSGTLAFIEFTVLGTGTGGIDVDDSPPSTVPEPGTLALFATGLGMAKAWRVRRSQRRRNPVRTSTLSVSALALLTTLALTPTGAHAQTTAPGPYYAPPAWDQQLRCDTAATCPRFIVLSDWYDRAGDFFIIGVAVLDRETGLVWQRGPLASPQIWVSAHLICNQQRTGNRKGWRLPTIQELASLIDPSAPVSEPKLPAGHPFLGVQTSNSYWSATTYSFSPDSVWAVSFENGSVSPRDRLFNGVYTNGLIWCVRGGHSPDAQ